MELIDSLLTNFIEHPVAAVVTFIVVFFIFTALFSNNNPFAAISSIFRLFSTIFSTPFVFLKSAIAIMMSAASDEDDYINSRQFVLFRYSRIQYLSIFVLCIIVISSGVTAAIFALYPSSELAAIERLERELADQDAETLTLKANITELAAPGGSRTLAAKRADAERAFAAARSKENIFFENVGFRADLLTSIRSSEGTEDLETIESGLDNYFEDCPEGSTWNNFTTQDCDEMRGKSTELIKLRRLTLAASDQLNDASQAYSNRSEFLIDSRERLKYLIKSRTELQNQLRDESPFRSKVILMHIRAAAGILLTTFGVVILIVWAGAIAIEFLNWIIFIMRSMEKLLSSRGD
jgi:hypothetical protein